MTSCRSSWRRSKLGGDRSGPFSNWRWNRGFSVLEMGEEEDLGRDIGVYVLRVK